MALSKSEIQHRYKLRHPERVTTSLKKWQKAHPDYANQQMKHWKANHQERYMINKARFRAKKRGVPCTITGIDVFIPSFCPVLGVPLYWGDKQKSDNSPSLDCFIPALGYVPGNVFVISMRANRLKGDATLAEVEKILSWMRGIQC